MSVSHKGTLGSLVLLSPDLMEMYLPFCSVRTNRTLCCVNKTFHKTLNEPQAWRVLCLSLAGHCGLYVPRDYSWGWKVFFWEHLWPARVKWTASGSQSKIQQDFKIRVVARFKPKSMPDVQAKNRFLLPLHQRIQLVRQGKLNRENVFDHDEKAQTSNLAEALVDNAQLSPDMMEAVLEAMQLQKTTHSAEHAEHQSVLAPWKSLSSSSSGTHFEEEKTADPASATGASASSSSSSAPTTNNDVEFREAWTNERITAAAEMHGMSRAREIHYQRERMLEEAKRAYERRGGAVKLLAVQPSRAILFVPKVGVRPFVFSRVFAQASTQDNVYHRSARDSVISVLNGFNSCFLCYGQTGSGKTHTMFGPPGSLSSKSLSDAKSFTPPTSSASSSSPSSSSAVVGTGGQRVSKLHGVVLRACSELLEAVFGAHSEYATQCRLSGISTKITVQYVQLYQDVITDLLNGQEVRLQDRGTHYGAHQFALYGATELPIRTLADVQELLLTGEKHKSRAATAMNLYSSRAHTLFIVTCEQTNLQSGTTIESQLHLVDLAGSEQIKQSHAVGQQFAEAVGINSSLLVLAKVITALVKGQTYVPYRDSRLTMLLKSALGGNSRTTVMVTCSSDGVHGDQTLHTLRFGERCSLVTNTTKFSTLSLDSALHAVREALRRCRLQMTHMEQRGNSNMPIYTTLQSRYRELLEKSTVLTSAVRAHHDKAQAGHGQSTAPAPHVPAAPST